jgi:hypothetical protein
MRRVAGWREKDPFGLADGEVRPTALGDFNPAPGATGIEEDEQVGGAVAPVFAIVTLDLPGRTWLRRDPQRTGSAFGTSNCRAMPTLIPK